MNTKRQELQKLLDALPNHVLVAAENALKYCLNPAETRFAIEQARKRVQTMSLENLEQRANQTGTGFITTVGTGVGAMKPNGDYRGSMSAWDNGPLTYHLQVFNGHMFEIYERLELTKNGTALTITQRIVGPTGTDQMLTANIDLPLSSSTA